MSKDPLAFINKMAAELGLTGLAGKRSPEWSYFRHSYRGLKDSFAFGWTTTRDVVNGKFYALKYRIRKEKDGEQWTLIKKVAFAKRKTAKKRTIQWYDKRKPAFDRYVEREKAKPPKPKPTALEKAKKKLEKAQAYIRRHETRLKRLTKLIRKWKKKQKYYSKRIKELENQQ